MKIYVIAGELSGDKLGASLMQGLKQLHEGTIEFHGVGGPLMATEGLTSQFPMEELSVLGFVEILPKYFELKRRIRECADAILDMQPDVVITIDSPEFCLRVAKLVREASDLRTVHYVAPSVWAWREGRAAKMAPIIDQVLALLPFEPPYMEAHGMRCDFVGHPVVAEPVPTADDVTAFRAELELSDDPVVLLLPGSRKSEVTRLLPTFRATMERLQAERPELQFLLPAAGPVVGLVQDMTADMAHPPVILDPTGMSPQDAAHRKRCAFHAADVALAASGTVSLELSAAGTPMVIAYDVSWLSRKVYQRLLKIDTLTLANLVTDTRKIPEFLGEDCVPEKIASGVIEVLNGPDEQKAIVEETMLRLGRGSEDPGIRAAKAVLDGLKSG